MSQLRSIRASECGSARSNPALQHPAMVRVLYIGPIRMVSQSSSETVEIEGGITVMDVLNYLCRKHGQQFQELLLHNGTINRAVGVFVDGAPVSERKDLLREIGQDSEIQLVLLSQAAGG